MSATRFTPLSLPGVVLIQPPRHGDGRGYFMETFRNALYRENGVEAAFVQDNQAGSARRGTVRGLHFQAPPHAQAKLVRVLKGKVLDVAVDLRKDSSAYGRWCAAELSAEGGEQVYLPEGVAHAYCSLTDNVEIAYKVSSYYALDSEGGLMWNDPALAIDWPVAPEEAILSDRDRRWPSFDSFISPF